MQSLRGDSPAAPATASLCNRVLLIEEKHWRGFGVALQSRCATQLAFLSWANIRAP